jgi:hypothetical protein
MADKMSQVSEALSQWRCFILLTSLWTQLINLSEQNDINPHLRSIRVVRGKIEATETQSQITQVLGGTDEVHKVDTIVSEPIGVLLFHERMVSTSSVSSSQKPVN